jgi:hypothetical protein
MNLKRDKWTNDEVIKILEGCKIYIGEKKRSEAQLEYLDRHNQGIEQAIIQFCDFKADPEESYSAMAYDTENGQIYVISPPLPQ